MVGRSEENFIRCKLALTKAKPSSGTTKPHERWVAVFGD